MRRPKRPAGAIVRTMAPAATILTPRMRSTTIGAHQTAGACMPSLSANDLDLDSPESIRANLLKLVGERITIGLVGGLEMQGVVNKVGGASLHMTELTGKEFFDAVVRIDHISAITVKMRNK
jgi:hypothetical protein